MKYVEAGLQARLQAHLKVRLYVPLSTPLYRTANAAACAVGSPLTENFNR